MLLLTIAELLGQFSPVTWNSFTNLPLFQNKKLWIENKSIWKKVIQRPKTKMMVLWCETHPSYPSTLGSVWAAKFKAYIKGHKAVFSTCFCVFQTDSWHHPFKKLHSGSTKGKKKSRLKIIFPSSSKRVTKNICFIVSCLHNRGKRKILQAS